MRLRPLALLPVLIAVTGCGLITGAGDEFVPAVDSLHVPESLATSEPLPVFLSLRFGSSSCTRFARIEVERGAALVRLRPIGRTTGDRECTADIWTMDTTLVVPGPHQPSIEGRLDLEVVQRGGNAHRSIIIVDPRTHE